MSDEINEENDEERRKRLQGKKLIIKLAKEQENIQKQLISDFVREPKKISLTRDDSVLIAELYQMIAEMYQMIAEMYPLIVQYAPEEKRRNIDRKKEEIDKWYT
ncbi:MAG: hypothetical protein ACFFD4_02215 [Candidatus Odinarchaeota archaeon]